MIRFIRRRKFNNKNTTFSLSCFAKNIDQRNKLNRIKRVKRRMKAFIFVNKMLFESTWKKWKNESALGGTWYAEVATPKTKLGGKSLRETEAFSLSSFSLRKSSFFTIFVFFSSVIPTIFLLFANRFYRLESSNDTIHTTFDASRKIRFKITFLFFNQIFSVN